MLTRIKSLMIVLVLGLLLAATGRPGYADGVVPGYILVKPAPGVDINAVAAGYGVTVLDSVSGTQVVALSIPVGSTETAFAAQLTLDPRLVFAETDTYLAQVDVRGDPVHLAFDTALTDPTFMAQWAAPIGSYPSGSPLSQIDLGYTHQKTTGVGVTVAVLDTGIDAQHVLFQGHVLPGFNVRNSGTPPFDAADGQTNNAVGHGTMVAGIILRVAPGTQILPIRVLNGDGMGSARDVANGVMLAIQNGARVINMSLGSAVRSKTLDDAMDAAETAGVTCIAASGNGGANVIQYPSSRAEVIVVASVESNNVKSSYSNYGKSVKVVAPGSNIRNTYLNGGFATWSGTSFAAPFVAGQAALILSLHPEYLPTNIKDAVCSSAQSVDKFNPAYRGDLGKGLIDIDRSVRKL